MDLNRSTLRALLPAGHAPGVTEIHTRLAGQYDELQCDHGCINNARWALSVRSGDRALRVAMVPSQTEGIGVHLGGDRLDPAHIERAEASDFSIVVESEFGDQPLWDFHDQLQLLAAAAGDDVVLVVDDNACAIRTPEWLAEVTQATTPPNPTFLYAVHCVFDEHGVWVHTHGLRRCGSIELEMLDLPKGCAQSLSPLLKAVAAMWIEHGAPEPGELFEAGKDMPLIWTPWEKALEKYKPKGPGGEDDRDPIHSVPSGVLMVPKEGWTGRKLCCPSSLAPTLEGNPMLFVSNMETSRMALLAAEKLPRFVRLLGTHGGDEEWRFLVKLGYVMDDAEDEDQREHLWFDAHGVEGDQVDATLLNQPYYIDRLREGERGLHPLEKLSDWAIVCPHGRYGPDSAHDLEAVSTN